MKADIYDRYLAAGLSAGHSPIIASEQAEEALRLRSAYLGEGSVEQPSVEQPTLPGLSRTTLPGLIKPLLSAHARKRRVVTPELQCAFLLCATHLIQHICTMPEYFCTGSYLYRDPACNKAINGTEDSNHLMRLAIDLAIFKNGDYLTKTANYRLFGMYWEEIGRSLDLPLRWGGRYNDGNHFELQTGWKRESMV